MNPEQKFNPSLFKGVIRDKTRKFYDLKPNSKFKNDRFKSKQSDLFKNFHDRYSDEIEDNDSSLLKSGDAFTPADPYNTHQREKHILPPRWVDQEEEIEENIIRINENLLKLEQEVNKIKRHEYMTKEQIPLVTIETLNSKIINLIRKSELELQEIKSMQLANVVDRKVKDNVHYSLAIKLKEAASKTSKLEKELVKHMEVDANKDDKQDDLIDGFEDDEEMNQKQVLEKRMNQAKTQEIEEIVNAANDLATLFKELSVLVIEQGTVLDRIDYNVETALVNTKKGKKHLVKAKEYSESSRARNIILCLAASILFCVVLLIIKKY